MSTRNQDSAEGSFNVGMEELMLNPDDLLVLLDPGSWFVMLAPEIEKEW